jgi:hypothetical protein
MDQIIRILYISFRYRDSNLRYKVVYLRTNYRGYNIVLGDILDQEIYRFFENLNPIQIIWELYDVHTENNDYSRYFNTFRAQLIPLLIHPRLASNPLDIYEYDRIQAKGETFRVINRQVTLLYRANMDENHENWCNLPAQIRIDIDNKIQARIAQTVFPYV